MLWTDADFINAADVQSLDNEVAMVAAAEGIILDGSTGEGVIHRAAEEAGDALLKHMQQFGGGWCGDGSVSATHYMAVMNTGLPQSNRASVLLSQIVVSDVVAQRWSALKRWVAYWALMRFYEDAANRTQNDRYADKAQMHRKALHGPQWAALRAGGLPIVNNPLPCPGAIYEPAAGTWGPGNVTTVSGAGTVTGSWDVVVTYLDATRLENGESHPSARVTVDLQPGLVLRVDIGSLLPPTGKQPASTRARAYVAYGTATAWKVYAGPSGGPLYGQAEIPIATTVYNVSADPSTDTLPVGLGQYPDTYKAFQNWNQRG